MEMVEEVFCEAHSDWSVTAMSSASSFTVKYSYAPSLGTLADAVAMCGGDSSAIADMSQEELYELSGYLKSTSSASLQYRLALSSAWSEKMTFTYVVTGE